MELGVLRQRPMWEGSDNIARIVKVCPDTMRQRPLWSIKTLFVDRDVVNCL